MNIGEMVNITSGIREGLSGPLTLILNGVHYVDHGEIGTRPYYAEELKPVDIAPKASKATEETPKARKPSKQATKAVLRNLDKEVDGNRYKWQSLISRDMSLDVFRTHAIKDLGDTSELKSSTLESADWQEIYAYYMDILTSDDS